MIFSIYLDLFLISKFIKFLWVLVFVILVIKGLYLFLESKDLSNKYIFKNKCFVLVLYEYLEKKSY